MTLYFIAEIVPYGLAAVVLAGAILIGWIVVRRIRKRFF
jgi:hypothetical protein